VERFSTKIKDMRTAGKKREKAQKTLDIRLPRAIMVAAFLRGLEKAPTFLVPIINPPFADNSPHFSALGISDEGYHAAAPGRGPGPAPQSA
jgi:hypothetical protein